MFVKLAVFACLVASCLAVWNGPLAGGVPAHQYPAGVSPQACPNFPNCANPAVAAQPNAPAQWNGAPQPAWNAQPQPQWNQYNPQPVPQWNAGQQSALDQGQYTGDGDYHGEGLAESGAYGNNGAQWNNGNQWNNGQYNAGNQWNNPGAYNHAGVPGAPAQVPAGVDASSCPNYPFCH